MQPTPERSVNEIVARFYPEDESEWPGKPITIGEIHALIADWRARGEEIEKLRVSVDLREKELDAGAACMKDLGKRMATAGRDAAEDMRARCEAIARAEYERTRLPVCLAAERIADAIAALAPESKKDPRQP